MLLMIAIFLVSQLFLVWNGGQHGVFNSPDSTINYYFAKQQANHQALGYPAFKSDWSEFISPRSARVLNDQIVPVSFLGLINIYGFLGGIFSVNILPYLTVIFATIALIYFYLFIKKMFSHQIAWWSTLFLIIHPAWFYYTNRSFLPNMLFVSLLIPAIFYWYQTSQRTSRLDFFLAGIFTGAALYVRTSEIIWVGALLLVFLIRQRQAIFISKLMWALVGSLPFIWLLVANAVTIFNGSPSLGYNLVEGGDMNILTAVSNFVFPFGVHPRLILSVLSNYGLWIFLPLTVFSAVGLLTIREYFNQSKHASYLSGLMFMSLYLLIYYGSWLIVDSPDPTKITIGTSYVRYFLPIYIFAVPYAAFFITRFSNNFSPSRRRAFVVLTVAVLMAFSINLTVFEPLEGIIAQRANLGIYDRTAGKVLAVTEGQGVVLTFKGDKYLWPAQAVVVPGGDQNYLIAVKGLLTDGTAVYFLNPALTETGEQEFQHDWSAYGFDLGELIFSDEGLSFYKLKIAGT